MLQSLFATASHESKERQRLQAAETQLMEWAQVRYQDEDDNDRSTVSWESLDTIISSDRILSANQQQEDLTMHSIHVSNPGAPVKTPLILLHGYMNGAAYYYRNLFGLSQSFGSIYSVDLLGWGLSSRPKFTATSIEETEAFFCESLEAWRVAQGLERIILVGHSMGGYLAVAYTERYPATVQELILLSPAGVVSEAVTAKERQRRQAALAQPPPPRSWTRRMLFCLYQFFFLRISIGDACRWLPSNVLLRRIQTYVQRRLDLPQDEADVLASYLHASVRLPGSAEYCLNRILTPTLCGKHPLGPRVLALRACRRVSFVYGQHDWMDPAHALALQEQAAASRRLDKTGAPTIVIHGVPAAGHLLMLDNWRGLNAILVKAIGVGHPPGTVEDAVPEPPIDDTDDRGNHGGEASSRPFLASFVTNMANSSYC